MIWVRHSKSLVLMSMMLNLMCLHLEAESCTQKNSVWQRDGSFLIICLMGSNTEGYSRPIRLLLAMD